MRTTLLTRMLGQASWLMLLWPSATIHAKLPAAVAINEGAGRGDFLIVPVRMARGDELPFAVDTGSSGTLLDESLEPLSSRTTRVEALEPLIKAVLQEEAGAARWELAAIEQGGAAELTKVVAKKLAATLGNEPKPTPDSVPPQVTQLALGDAKPTIAEVGWLQPAANRIPPSKEIHSPLLDSGRVYATGLYAHSPSRYVFQLSGRWRKLRGEAGLHTAFQPYAFGVVFVIKTDGKEVFRSSIIRGTANPKYEIDLTAVKSLELLVEQATDRNGGNWALWLDPTLFRDRKAPGNDARSLTF